MAVDTPKKAYTDNLAIWKRCRDIIAGEDVVKAAKTTYLPKPEEMEDDTYKTFVARATFYNASERTAGGYEGMIFRKEPEVRVPASVEPYLSDITLSAQPFEMFARDTCREVIEVGRCGILVDVQAEGVANRRPYLSLYQTESIIKWETENRGGDEVLTLVTLSETKIERDPKDEFEIISREALRVLTLGPVSTPDVAGVERNFDKDVYRVRLYVKKEGDDKKVDWQLELDTVPTFANGDPLDFIPFQFVGACGVTPEVKKPPLLDLVNMNLSHYRSSADLEWAAYFIAMPQVYITGVQDAKLKRAPNTVWKISDASAKVDIVGGGAEEISALVTMLDKKEKKMATLGARLLEEQKREAEAAETLRLRQSGEQASLSTISASVSFGLEQALKWLSLWSGASDEQVSVNMNTVFVDESADPQLIANLFEQLQNGKISYQTFYQNLVRFGIARDGISAEEELKQIDSEIPSETM